MIDWYHVLLVESQNLRQYCFYCIHLFWFSETFVLPSQLAGPAQFASGPDRATAVDNGSGHLNTECLTTGCSIYSIFYTAARWKRGQTFHLNMDSMSPNLPRAFPEQADSSSVLVAKEEESSPAWLISNGSLVVKIWPFQVWGYWGVSNLSLLVVYTWLERRANYVQTLCKLWRKDAE